jgi:hypothetical protein
MKLPKFIDPEFTMTFPFETPYEHEDEEWFKTCLIGPSETNQLAISRFYNVYSEDFNTFVVED